MNFLVIVCPSSWMVRIFNLHLQIITADPPTPPPAQKQNNRADGAVDSPGNTNTARN